MLLRAVLAAGLTGLAACTVGAPPGFSSGDSWAFPLVGPLEDGPLLVPVTINGKGPFLFLLDPDAPATSIDEGLAGSLDLYGGRGPRLTDESDTERPTKSAEVSALTVGNLTVTRPRVLVHKTGTFAAAGRDLVGIIGRDLIAESLVFAFDRDAGMAYLVTRDAFTAPEGALRLRYRDEPLKTGLVEVGGTTRRLVSAEVNGTARTLHVDLGATQSQLRADLWKDARLTPLPFHTTLIDEVGTARTVDKGGIANEISVGGTTGRGVLMVPYGDRRTDPELVDGTLGLNFFAPYSVWADWSGRSLYVKPRDAVDKRQVRLARWSSSTLAACAEPACVTAARVPGAEPPAAPPVEGAADGDVPAPPVVVEVTREASASGLVYEVTLDAVDAGGLPLGLPRLVATLPRGATTVRQKVSPMYAEARFVVADVSPFVRICRQPGGCIFELPVAR